jgi:hypothetical protein
VIPQWLGVIAILFGLIAWTGLPTWTRAIALLLSVAIMLAFLRVELTIGMRDLDARIATMEADLAAEATTRKGAPTPRSNPDTTGH